MAKVSRKLVLDTLLGRLSIEAYLESRLPENGNLLLEASDIQPSMPSHMRVDRCRAVLVEVAGTRGKICIRLTVHLDSEAEGYSYTGEFLEAINWETDRGVLVVGTEDAPALSHRMPWFDVTMFDVIARYTPRGMEIRLAAKPEMNPSTFHLIIAENPSPEPVPDSAWFAVDMPHELVLQAFGKAMPGIRRS